MESAAIDYKKLYEESLVVIAEKELLISEKEEQLSERDELISQLRFEMGKFLQELYGKKSEKLSSRNVDLAQMNLFDLSTPVEQQEVLSEEAVEGAKKKIPKKRAKGTGRMALPEELRREIIIIEPDEDVSGCVKIGEEITEVLAIIPAELYVKRYQRNKYARPNGEGIIIGRLPERVIEKGIPSNELVAEIMTDKYVYGMPLHRQRDKYRRLGVNIPASTTSDWIIKGWKHLIPLWELLKLMIINQKYLQVDESTIKVQDKQNKNKIHTGYMWVYHAPCDKLVLFDYRRGRDQSGPKEVLKDYQGIIQTDGYQVYETLYGNHPHIMLVYCMAHARRKFVDALGYDKAKATEVLERMGQLYTIEQDMRDKGFTWEQRTAERQLKALPVLDDILKWLQDHANTVLPKSPLGQAIAYTLPRWGGLSAYAQHGQIEIDNNLIENSIRPLAIGRKNYLFAGSHDAAEMTAAMYSFMATCKKNGINELQWLADVLARTQSINHKELYQLLPNNWAKYKSAREV